MIYVVRCQHPTSLHLPSIAKMNLKIVSATFLLACFLSRNKSTCQSRKNILLLHFKTSFRSRENQVLEFQIFRFHDAIEYLSINQEIHFIEWFGRWTQSVNEIWPDYVKFQKKSFHLKIMQRPENYVQTLLCLRRIKHNLYCKIKLFKQSTYISIY